MGYLLILSMGNTARAALLSIVLAWASTAQAGIYTYTLADGTIVYTNQMPSGVSLSRVRKLRGNFTPAPKPSDPPAVKPAQAVVFDTYVKSSALRYQIPVALVQAIMHAESNFNTRAVSPKGALGLMQLMPTTAQGMYVKDILSPEQNIDGGVRYLRVLANLFDGDMVKMVAAYNAGPEAVRRARGMVPPFAETQDYVRKVLALYYQYKQSSASVARTP